MASTTQKWFIGCGIGCGLIILVGALIGGGLFFAIKDVVKEGESIDESFEAMDAAFGEARHFTPSLDGAIAYDRMEVFLDARDASAESREKMASILYTLDDDDGGQGDSGILAKIKAGATLIPATLSFIKDRNEHLLDQGMGVGEYTYIYSLAYFAYLDKDLTDGPSFQMTGDDRDEDDRGFTWKVESGDDSKVLDKREREIRRHLHYMQLDFLINQISAMEEAVGVDDGWLEALRAEKVAMDSASRRLLWEEELPSAIAASFGPFVDRLEESYSPIMNVIEVGMINND